MDGKPIETFLVNGIARGFIIETPGNHTLEVKYDITLICIGGIISILALLLITFYLFGQNPIKILKRL